jgi:acetyltransferase-like isoleucine patch superfamily enzyme
MSRLKIILRYEFPMHFILLLTNWLPDNVIFLRIRGILISPFFKKCGKNLRVGRNNVFYDSFEIILGDDIYISNGNWFNGSGGIQLEDQVMIGPKCNIVTSNHSLKNGSFRYGASVLHPIKIGFGSWIGGNCTILAGTSIGKCTLIGANSLVKGELVEGYLYAGNPVKKIKKINV